MLNLLPGQKRLAHPQDNRSRFFASRLPHRPHRQSHLHGRARSLALLYGNREVQGLVIAAARWAAGFAGRGERGLCRRTDLARFELPLLRGRKLFGRRSPAFRRGLRRHVCDRLLSATTYNTGNHAQGSALARRAYFLDEFTNRPTGTTGSAGQGARDGTAFSPAMSSNGPFEDICLRPASGS